MSIITFTSDFGTADHYVAAVKAQLLSLDSEVRLIDISHSIESFNIAQGSFVLKSVYPEFPKDTVHLVAVDAQSSKQRYIAVRLDGHFFVSADNGLISLLSDQSPDEMVQLKVSESTTFSTKEILAPVAVALGQGTELSKLGCPLDSIEKKLPRQLKATRQQIVGHVVHVDHYGNLITNIDLTTFQYLQQGASFQLRFGRENTDHIHQHYHNVDYGEVFLLFNSSGWLEIGINQGNAHELLGLGYDSPVTIRFTR